MYNKSMPSNKTFIVLIICSGVIVSLWLLLQTPKEPLAPVKNVATVSTEAYINIDESNYGDWKKVLTDIDQKTQQTTILTKNSTQSNDTTLTSQMARDFFSQYLILKKGGQAVTQDEVDKIVENTLSLPEYTKSTGPVYTIFNLHVNQKKDVETVKKYLNDLQQMIENRKINDNNDEPMAITGKAMRENKEGVLVKLDPIIIKAKGVISDLIKMDVPADATNLHLSLLNVTSDMLSNLEAMRASFIDPVRAFVGFNKYPKNLLDFENTLGAINTYFSKKL